MEKNIKEQNALRESIYDIAIQAVVNEMECSYEPIKGGYLVKTTDGRYAKIVVSICGEDKVEQWRQEYEESVAKKLEKMEKKEEKEREKAEKKAAREAKKAEKEKAEAEEVFDGEVSVEAENDLY